MVIGVLGYAISDMPSPSMMGIGKGSGAADVPCACFGRRLRAPLHDCSMVAWSLLIERALWRGASRAVPPVLIGSAKSPPLPTLPLSLAWFQPKKANEDRVWRSTSGREFLIPNPCTPSSDHNGRQWGFRAEMRPKWAGDKAAQAFQCGLLQVVSHVLSWFSYSIWFSSGPRTRPKFIFRLSQNLCVEPIL
jgi:hypothetical protein